MPGGIEVDPDVIKPPKHGGGGKGGGGGGATGPTIPVKVTGFGTIQVPAAADTNNDGKVDQNEFTTYAAANPDWSADAFGGGGSDTSSGGTSSSSGSSSGGSSGGSSAAPPDPDAPLISAGTSKYMQMWGEPPPSNLISHLVKSESLNIWQMEDLWRHDPAFLKTKTAQNEADGYAQTLHALGAA